MLASTNGKRIGEQLLAADTKHKCNGQSKSPVGVRYEHEHRMSSMWLVSFETPLSCFVPLLARSAQEFFGPTTAARHAPVLYLAPAHLSLRSCVSQILISTFLTLLIDASPAQSRLTSDPPRSGVSGRETLSAHYFSSPSLSLKRHATHRCITRPAGHLSATSQNIYVILVFSKISILLTLYGPYLAIPGSPPHRNYVQLVVNNQHTGSLVSYISTHEATASRQTGC
jgi:hypothetical protein